MKNQKGITLIALVITVIVLMILAGVGISVIIGDVGILGKTQTADEKTRVGQIKEYLALTIKENEIAKHQNEKQITREDVIDELKQKNLLTDEEIKTLNESDVITISDVEIDFSEFEDSGFKYIGKKYLIRSGSGTYMIVKSDFSCVAYDKSDNLLLEIPSTNVIGEKTKITLINTGDFDGEYIVSDDSRYIYNEMPDGRYYAAVEKGFCKHYYEGDAGLPWVDYDFSDMNNPVVCCGTCGDEIDTVVIDGVLYAYNVSLDLVECCVDAYYDESLNGYCALVIDRTKENIVFEDQINGIDVVRVAGFMDLYDDSVPAVKTVKLPARVRELFYAFSRCSNLTSISAIPDTVTNMYYAFLDCTSLTGEIEINTNNLNTVSGWKEGSCAGCFSGTTQPIKLTGTASDEVKSLLVSTSKNGNISYE